METGRHSALHRILAFLTAFALAATLLPGSPARPVEAKANGTYILANETANGTKTFVIDSSWTHVEIDGGGTTITMDSGLDGILVEQGFEGTIVLKNVNIQTPSLTGNVTQNGAAMRIDGFAQTLPNTGKIYDGEVHSRVKLVLEGKNVLWSGYTHNGSVVRAGLEVGLGALVHIQTVDDPNGDLTARSGVNSSGTERTPGIGAVHTVEGYIDGNPVSGGHIIISSGTVYAYGGFHAASIGGAVRSSIDAETRYLSFAGTVFIYGGHVECHGASHGFGIGAACDGVNAVTNVNHGGTVVVLPPATVKDERNRSSSTFKALGGVDNVMWIGDPEGEEFRVRTESDDVDADIHINISNVELLCYVFDLAEDSSLHIEDYPIGVTGTVGGDGHAWYIEKGSFNNVDVTFFTNTKTPKDNNYLPVETDLTKLRDIVLPAPYLPAIEYKPENKELTYGYNDTQAGDAAGTVTIWNDGDGILEGLDIDGLTELWDDYVETGAITAQINGEAVSDFSSFSDVKLWKDDKIIIKTQIQDGKPVDPDDYAQDITVKGQDEKLAEEGKEQEVSVTVTQEIKQKEGADDQIQVTATPDTATINASAPKTGKNVSVDVKIGTHTWVEGTYWITNSPSFDFSTDPYNHKGSLTTGVQQVVVDEDHDQYIHWEIKTNNVITRSGDSANHKSFGFYHADTILPKVTGVSFSRTVLNNDPFTINIVFSEPVREGELKSKLNITSGIVIDSVAIVGGETVFIPPLTGNAGPYSKEWLINAHADDSILMDGDVISLTIPADIVSDPYNNSNEAYTYTEKQIIYNTKVPSVEYSFTADQEFKDAAPDYVEVTVYANTATADKSLTINGSTVLPANAQTMAEALFTITEKGTNGTRAFTATFVPNTSGGVFRLTPTTPFKDHDTYTVAIADQKLTNVEGSPLPGEDRSFKVAVPVVEKVEASETLLPLTGGTSTITISGRNLQNASQLDLYKLLPDNAAAYRPVAPGASDTLNGRGLITAQYTANLAPNSEAEPKDYTYIARINDTVLDANPDTKAIVRVSGAEPKIVSFIADPTGLPSEGGEVELIIRGENLGNFADLKIAHTDSLTSRNDVYNVTGLAPAETYYSMKLWLPANDDIDPAVHTFALYDGSVDLSYNATVTVAPALPELDKENALTADPDFFDNEGGDSVLTIKGVNLHNFRPLEIYDHVNSTLYEVTDISPDRERAFLTVTLPLNRTRDDAEYPFEIYTDNNATNVIATVTVERSKPVVEEVIAEPDRHDSGGGYSQLTLKGKYLDNADLLELVETVDTDESFRDRHQVTDISTDADATSATITLGFSGNIGPRNDIHNLEAYVDGEASGASADVEVGDSIPFVTGIDANPDRFTREQTLYGKGKSAVTIHGGYLYNYDLLELYDVVSDDWYTVRAVEPDDDRTATYTVTVPSNAGWYEYKLYVDGQESGYVYGDSGASLSAWIGVDATGTPGLGDSGGYDGGAKRDVWTHHYGGAKGDSWSGNPYSGFDILSHHAEQAILQNPGEPVVTLQNIPFLLLSQITVAYEKGVAAGGKFMLHFDTLDEENDGVVEGRLYFNPEFASTDLWTGVYTRDSETKKARARVMEEFDNENVFIVKLSQKGSYETRVEVAAFARDSGFDLNEAEELHFYVYTEDGEYKVISNPEYETDQAGYVYFHTKEGGDIVVTDRPLTKEGREVELDSSDQPRMKEKRYSLLQAEEEE